MDLSTITENAKLCEFATVYPIENFTIDELNNLSTMAESEGIDVCIKYEHSNFYRGTVIKVQRQKDTVDDRLKNEVSTYEIRVFNHKNNAVSYKRLSKYEAWQLNKHVNLKWDD